MAASSESSYVRIMRSARWALAALLGIAAGCSGPSHPAPRGPDSPTPASDADAGTDVAPLADAAPGTPLTDAECDDFIDHVFAIAARKRAGEVPPDQANTDEEVRAASEKEKQKAETRQMCKKLTRELYDCAMKAPDAAALAACDAAHGETPDPR